MIKKPELLSPAGDMTKLKAAFAYGADAVYAGGHRFGLRVASANFSNCELYEAVALAHALGKKFYLTLNVTPLNSEIEGVCELIKTADACGVDAVIVADIGIMSLVKKYAPDMEIHISTQAGVTNYVTARELYEMGAKRIVLARELSLDDIALIRDKIQPECEIEVFVHGAMCVSFSGRCLLSNYMISRDGNRGECAQPCRWKYSLVEEKRPGEYHPVFEDGGTYILNSKDLCLIEHTDKLIRAGVDSFKIEGRVKTESYVAAVTKAYREAIDDAATGKEFNSKLLVDVCKVSHREYYTGFLFGNPTDSQIYSNNSYVRDYEISAVIDGFKDGYAVCRAKNVFKVGDELEFFTPDGTEIFTLNELKNEKGESVTLANHPESVYLVPCEKEFKLPSYIRKKTM